MNDRTHRSRTHTALKLGAIAAMLLTLWLVVSPARAQTGAPISATVDRAQLSTDNTLTLTIEVASDGSQFAQPVVPALDGFTVVGQNSATQSTIVNGVGTTRVTYMLRLQPQVAGTLTVPPISVEQNGVVYTTEPIQIEVTQGTGASQLPEQPVVPPTELSGQDFYVEAEVDNATPYLGEQLTYTFRFYYASGPSRSPNYEPPEFSGFWNEYEPEQRSYTTDAAGRAYRVVEIQTVLFPAVAGELTIDPTTLDIPGGFFTRGVTLQTTPVTVDVQPLPQGAPESFVGAVGAFALDSKVEPATVAVDEPVTLDVVISGSGNVTTMGDPIWEPGDQWRAFDPDVRSETSLANGVISGQRQFEQMLLPTEPGELTLPPVEYSYFDPVSAEYRTLTSDSVTILVTGDAERPVTTLSMIAEPNAPDLPEIRGIDPQATALKAASEPLAERGLFAVALAVPLVLLGAQGVRQAQNAYRTRNSAAYRSKHAAKTAHSTLADASATGSAAAVATRVLSNFLSAKLGQPVSGMTQAGIGAALAAQGVSAESISRVNTVFASAEAQRFAPTTDTSAASATDTALLREVGDLIDTLDRQL